MGSTTAPTNAAPTSSSSFSLLDERIQRWIWDAGWTELKDVQERAIPLPAGAVEPLGPGGEQGSPIVSFVFRNKKTVTQDFNLFLNNELPGHVICARCGSHCAIPLHRSRGLGQSLRLSFFIYNTEREVSLFLGALEEYLAGAARR